MNKIAVVAIGGNSLISEKGKESMEHQMEAVKETCKYLADMVEMGWNIVITHGNGPQVGFGLRRSEIAAKEIPVMPLEGIGGETQGNIGYMIQQSMKNELALRGIKKCVCTVVTQVEVDPNDPAFTHPTKPIGSFMSPEEAIERKEKEGWSVVEDSGRGFRRVVPSPLPINIIEKETIHDLIQAGKIVISAGGGGIPVINQQGMLQGVPAVIDKDYASALLANSLNADLLLISTGIEQVAINFNKPNQKNLAHVSLKEIQQYDAEGHFAAGSMGPKIQAVINYLNHGGKEAIITSPQAIGRAIQGTTGTHITH